jgi:glyoxylase-like metal-dependent hydrolase (beta-lactamase superfamily II)
MNRIGTLAACGAAALAAIASSVASAPAAQAPARALQWGTFPAQWIHGGPGCGSEPSIQVHAYIPDIYILRQSLCTDYEAPFLYLLFGTQRAILFDTGAGGIPIGATVRNLVEAWRVAHQLPSLQLVVAHLHAHGDHVAGDSQFQGQPDTVVVGTSLTAVRNFFGFTQWPTQLQTYDLGGRVLDVIPIPGHQTAHIAVYDRRTGILLTGDSLYPGRLYVTGAVGQGNWAVYRASVQRLVDFSATRPIAWVLGTHIEMTTTSGVDFPIGSTSHPDEHVLQLELRHLLELHAAVQAMTTPHIEIHPDFIVYPTG